MMLQALEKEHRGLLASLQGPITAFIMDMLPVSGGRGGWGGGMGGWRSGWLAGWLARWLGGWLADWSGTDLAYVCLEAEGCVLHETETETELPRSTDTSPDGCCARIARQDTNLEMLCCQPAHALNHVWLAHPHRALPLPPPCASLCPPTG
jgi:hypothetical protein